MDIAAMALTASTWIVPVLLAVTLHEAAHGWVAWRLGDDTAKSLGRVTFNPFRHIDVFGTVLLPALMLFASGGRMMFGFAKPVPVDFRKLHHPMRDMVTVAVAGPAANLFLASMAALSMHALPMLPLDARSWVFSNLINMVWINALLFCFNMLPLPPLDGGRVAVGILPRGLGMRLARLEPYGVFIVLGAIFVLPMLGEMVGLELDVFRWLVGEPAQWMANTIFHAAGIR